MGAIHPSKPVVQERSKLTDLEIMLQNWLPVGTVTEEDASTPNSLSDSLEGCFSCGVLTHTTDQCQALDESFPFLPTGWQTDTSETSSSWDRGLKRCPRASRWETLTDPGRGLVARISNDYEPQLPVVGEDILWLGVIFDYLVRIQTIRTAMCCVQKDMTEKCDRST